MVAISGPLLKAAEEHSPQLGSSPLQALVVCLAHTGCRIIKACLMVGLVRRQIFSVESFIPQQGHGFPPQIITLLYLEYTSL